MNTNYEINDFTLDSFVHGTIERFFYDRNSKVFQAVFSYLNLKHGGCLYECTIRITDWWDLEVIQYRGDKVINRFKGRDVPELDSIVDFTYDGNTLILEDLCGLDEIYHFKFTKPKIQITGEYDPD